MLRSFTRETALEHDRTDASSALRSRNRGFLLFIVGIIDAWMLNKTLKSKVYKSVLQTPIGGRYYFARFSRIPNDIPSGGRPFKSSEIISAKQVRFGYDVLAFPMVVSNDDFSSIESLT